MNYRQASCETSDSKNVVFEYLKKIINGQTKIANEAVLHDTDDSLNFINMLIFYEKRNYLKTYYIDKYLDDLVIWHNDKNMGLIQN